MLDYDDSAFYYFSITLLSIYLIPGIFYLLQEVCYAVGGVGDVGTEARTRSEELKAAKLKQASTGFARFRTTTFVVNLCILIFVVPLYIYLISLVRSDGEVSTFDPFQILGVEHGAGLKDIKKAYRSLSLKHHPDRNPGSKIAEEMFMKVTKAYEALTDPNSMKNWEIYGNPDGKQSLEVSIGLPRIVLDNPKVVLVLYLVVMVVLIPVGVGVWYAISKQYGEKNIKHETYTAFYQLMQETHRVKQMAEVMAASAECRTLNVPKIGDAEPMGKLYTQMKNEKLMPKPKYEHPMVLRGNLLLHAHLLRMTQNLTKVFYPFFWTLLSIDVRLSGLIWTQCFPRLLN
jgi:translocation protein SEC63